MNSKQSNLPWKSIQDFPKDMPGDVRVMVYSPYYKDGDPMRYRIMSAQFVLISTDATHFYTMSPPDMNCE